MTTTATPETGTSQKSFAFRSGYQTGWCVVQFGLVDTMFAATPRGDIDPQQEDTEFREGYEQGYSAAKKMGYVPELEYASHRLRSANLIGQPIGNGDPTIETVISEWATKR